MDLAPLFLTISLQFNLPPGLLSSLCYVESRYRINAIHHDDGNGNSIGVCQVKYKTAQWLGFKGTEKQLLNPRINIYYAAKYLRHQIDRYHSVKKGIIAYNLGHAGDLTFTKYQCKVMTEWVAQEH